MVKQILKAVVGTVVGLILLIAIAAVAVVLEPRILLNATTLSWVAKLAPRFGIEMNWETAHVDVESLSVLDKRFTFDFQGLCMSSAFPRRSACFSQLSATFEVALKKFQLKIPQLGPVAVVADEIYIEQVESEAPKKKKEETPFRIPRLTIPESLRETRFEPLAVEVRRLTVVVGDSIGTGTLSLKGTPDGEAYQVAVTASGAMRKEGQETLAAGATIILESPSHFLQDDWILRAAAEYTQPGLSATLDAKGSLAQQQMKGSYTAKADVNQKKRSAVVAMEGEFTNEMIQGVIMARAKNISAQLREASVKDCTFSLHGLDSPQKVAALLLQCKLGLAVVLPAVPPSPLRRVIASPTRLVFDTKAKMDIPLSREPRRPLDGTIELALNSVSMPLAQVEGTVTAHLSGIPAEYPKGWKLTLDNRLQASIPYFEKLVAAFDTTPWAIPAPLNVLSGSVSLDVAGQIDLLSLYANLQGQGQEVPIVFKTRLSSKDERLNIDGQGRLVVSYKEKALASMIIFDVLLNDLQIVMPRIEFADFRELPQLTSDARVAKPQTEKKKATSSSVARSTYTITISTPPQNPARLLSNLTQRPLPIGLKLRMDAQGLAGNVEIGKTRLNLFHRDAQLDHLIIALQDPRGMSELDGKIIVAYTEYTINVLLYGTIDRPRIIMQSDPPVPEDQLISTLIFGEPTDTLDTNDRSSVGNMAAALANRAVSLTSLYLLAATPVKSISYNPETSQFSAKVKVAKGTSLTVGTQGDKFQQVGLRRRIGKHLILNTYVTAPNQADQKKTTGAAFLEWSKRY